MTDVVSQVCGRCGADTDGTKFCENCGAPVTLVAQGASVVSGSASPPITPEVQLPVPATSGYSASHAGRKGTGWRVAALLIAVLCNFVPWFFTLAAQGGANIGSGATVVSIIALVLVALFLIVAAAVGDASQGGKVGAIICAILYVVLSIVVASMATQLAEAGLVAAYFVAGLVDFSLFFAWSLGRPFRGLGYIALIPAVLGVVLDQWVGTQLGLLFTVGYVAFTVLVESVAVATSLAILGLALLLERAHSARPQTFQSDGTAGNAMSDEELRATAGP